MRALLDLVLPARCAACGEPGAAACTDCLRPLALPARLAWPRPVPPGLPPPYVVAPYAGTTRRLLVAFKEDGVVALRAPLGMALAAAVGHAVRQQVPDRTPVWLVPAPSTRAARQERGDDVVARLTRIAAATCRRQGQPVRVVPALVHDRGVRDSAGLSAAERLDNLNGALRVRGAAAAAVRGWPVVLTDDLVTTGATLAEAARALRGVGACVLAAATVAATERRTQDGSVGSPQ